eukprot:Gb_05740 [translate_table: standard]
MEHSSYFRYLNDFEHPRTHSHSHSPQGQEHDGFDVFINHRGKDVKDTFASHIYDVLQLHGVRAFLDREEIQTGQHIPDVIKHAICSASLHIAYLLRALCGIKLVPF